MTPVEGITSGSLPIQPPAGGAINPKAREAVKNAVLKKITGGLAKSDSESQGKPAPNKASELTNLSDFDQIRSRLERDLINLFQEAYDLSTGQLKNEAALKNFQILLKALGERNITSDLISVFAEMTDPDLLPQDRLLLCKFLGSQKNKEIIQSFFKQVSERLTNLTHQALTKFLGSRGQLPYEKTAENRASVALGKVLDKFNLSEELIRQLMSCQLEAFEKLIRAEPDLLALGGEEVKLISDYVKEPSPANQKKILNCYRDILRSSIASPFGSSDFFHSQVSELLFELYWPLSDIPESEIKKVQQELGGLSAPREFENLNSLTEVLEQAKMTRDYSDDAVFARQYLPELKRKFDKATQKRRANLEALQLNQTVLDRSIVDFWENLGPNLWKAISQPQNFSRRIEDLGNHFNYILNEKAQQVEKIKQLDSALKLYGTIYDLLEKSDPEWLEEFQKQTSPPDFLAPSSPLLRGNQINRAVNFEWPPAIREFLKEKTYQGNTFEEFFKDDLILLSPFLKFDKLTSLITGAGDQEIELAGGGKASKGNFISIDTFDETKNQAVNPYQIFLILAHEGHHCYWAKSVSDRELSSLTINEGAAYLFDARTASQLINYLKSKNLAVPPELSSDYLASTFAFWSVLDVLGIAEKPRPETTTPEMFKKLPPEILKSRNLNIYPTNTTFFQSCQIALSLLTHEKNPNKILLEDLARDPQKILPLAEKINLILTDEKKIEEIDFPEEIKNILLEGLKNNFRTLTGQEGAGKDFKELCQLVRLEIVVRNDVLGNLRAADAFKNNEEFLKLREELFSVSRPEAAKLLEPYLSKLTPEQKENVNLLLTNPQKVVLQKNLLEWLSRIVIDPEDSDGKNRLAALLVKITSPEFLKISSEEEDKIIVQVFRIVYADENANPAGFIKSMRALKIRSDTNLLSQILSVNK